MMMMMMMMIMMRMMMLMMIMKMMMMANWRGADNYLNICHVKIIFEKATRTDKE